MFIQREAASWNGGEKVICKNKTNKRIFIIHFLNSFFNICWIVVSVIICSCRPSVQFKIYHIFQRKYFYISLNHYLLLQNILSTLNASKRINSNACLLCHRSSNYIILNSKNVNILYAFVYTFTILFEI